MLKSEIENSVCNRNRDLGFFGASLGNIPTAEIFKNHKSGKAFASSFMLGILPYVVFSRRKALLCVYESEVPRNYRVQNASGFGSSRDPCQRHLAFQSKG